MKPCNWDPDAKLCRFTSASGLFEWNVRIPIDIKPVPGYISKWASLSKSLK